MTGVLALLFSLSLGAEASAPVIPAPLATRRIPQVENAAVSAWKTIILPGQPLKMHRHERDRVLVCLRGGTLTKIEQDGRKSPLKFEAGHTYWLPKDPPGTMHADLNEGHEEIEVIVIELKTPEAP